MTRNSTTFHNPYAHSMSTGAENIELPRWRGHGAKPSENTLVTAEESIYDNDKLLRYSSLCSTDAPTTTSSSSPPRTPTTTLDRPIVRTLLFTRTILWSDLTISLLPSSPTPNPTTSPPPPPQPLYHASTHELNLTLPDIILYASTPTHPKFTVLAAAHFRFSRDARLGFGFGADLAKLNGKDTHDGDVCWESCRNTSTWLRHYQYDFAVPAEGDGGRGRGGRRHFRLERTRAAEDGVQGWLGWASFRNYRISKELDEGGGAEAVRGDE
ncbi:uncharacterized protein HMPREF1541_10707 [Cyphellophora europaea CBS 101466]|uniref:Uncharacterized protein n=1 Tax=Cyphellophora europaea (strain CBS 101466) TaxID=1220924 RepID=W2S627_CYPE1|nr:uncharacterized protein HMPREF1541_10707 [Cyphellophora europaea CBS 101466]ETN44157.1 hypothetical protein HMPREF1541_10707 [Cyphellophora europaea CBS 101466]